MKLVIPPLFNSPEVLSSASDKAKHFAEFFPEISNVNFKCAGEVPSVLPNTDLEMDKG